jgi:hypothetical protein
VVTEVIFEIDVAWQISLHRMFPAENAESVFKNTQVKGHGLSRAAPQ